MVTMTASAMRVGSWRRARVVAFGAAVILGQLSCSNRPLPVASGPPAATEPGAARAADPDPPPREDAAPDPNWDITAARGKPREIDFVTREGTWMSVDVSPDGKTIVFDLLAHIYRVSIDGGHAQCLTQGSGVATNFQPRFSRDGRHIA